MNLPETKFYHFHIYVISKEIHYDDRGSLASRLIAHPAVYSLGLYKESDDISSILMEYKFINTMLIDPYTLGFEETMRLIEFLRNPEGSYTRICIVLLNRNRESELLDDFFKVYPEKVHYLKLNYNYDVSDIEASSRLNDSIIEWQIRWFENLYTYELAVSYCSENNSVVGPIVNLLNEFTDKIFYDFDKRTYLVGKNLEDELPKVYGKHSRYCVIFVSKEYINKMWPILERKVALSRNELEPGYIIPISIDGTAIPEYSLEEHKEGYIKTNNRMVHYNIYEGPENAVAMILGKVWLLKPKSFNYFNETKR